MLLVTVYRNHGNNLCFFFFFKESFFYVEVSFGYLCEFMLQHVVSLLPWNFGRRPEGCLEEVVPADAQTASKSRFLCVAFKAPPPSALSHFRLNPKLASPNLQLLPEFASPFLSPLLYKLSPLVCLLPLCFCSLTNF